MKVERPFWEVKPLAALSPAEWDQLCDGCGQCCLHKLVDDESGQYFFTRIACRFLDLQTARCQVYEERAARMPTCMQLNASDASRWTWLPATCAYRLRAEGKRLPGWHPLVSGQAESVRLSGNGLPAQALSEDMIGEDELEDYVTSSRPV